MIFNVPIVSDSSMDPQPFDFNAPLPVYSRGEGAMGLDLDSDIQPAYGSAEGVGLFFSNLSHDSKHTVSDEPDSDVPMSAYSDAEHLNFDFGLGSGPEENRSDIKASDIGISKQPDDSDVVMPDVQSLGDLSSGKDLTLAAPIGVFPPSWMVSILQPGFVHALRMQNLKTITLEVDKILFSFE